MLLVRRQSGCCHSYERTTGIEKNMGCTLSPIYNNMSTLGIWEDTENPWQGQQNKLGLQEK